MAWYTKIFGDENEKTLKAIRPIVSQINALEADMKTLTDEQLRAKTAVFKEKIAQAQNAGETGSNDGYVNSPAVAAVLEEILPEAFAVVREASRRTLGQRHFDVQLIGGVILHRRSIAEMRTGEGKTLVATLPAYLNALTGKGVHVVTVNDYLSRRDASWMGQIYSFLGLSVAVINTDASYLYDPAHTTKEEDKERDQLGSFKVVHDFLRPVSRKDAYNADITYGTNNEFGFDYLRDNIEYDVRNLRQREFNYAIVDEIDSILIDEARTPLIISAPSGDSEDLYARFAKIAEKLHKDEDFTVDEKFHSITLTDKGIEKTEKELGVDNIYTEKGIKYVHHLETAVRAKALYHKDKEYVTRDGQIVIVDEFTGRLQPGRRWSEGLHQAIEAKEGLAVQKETRTYASITFQNYFRLYKKLAGMTGTAATSKEEFLKVYGLETTVVPTNVPIAREDHNDFIFQTETGKFKAIARKVKELNKKGQPVLIGTVSIEKNELLSEYLKREGVKHEMLNAKNHEREGEIIAQAGRKGAVTIATNMAGRGVDIKLGGNPAPAGDYDEVKNLGGLFVLGTERHEARRIDNQLRGRAGRQGDPGGTQFFVSLQDTLMRVFASDTIGKMMGRFGIAEDEPVENPLITRALESAQTKIEGFHFDSRKQVLEYDDVLNLQRKTIYEKRRKLLLGSDEVIAGLLSELTEGNEEMQKVVAEKEKMFGKSEFLTVVRRLFLQTIDMFWVDHLEMMDYLRGSVRLRGYGQRDPLVEYKREGLHLFKEMEASIKGQVLSVLPNIGAGVVAQTVQSSQVQAGRDEREMSHTQKQMEAITHSAPHASGVQAGATSSASTDKVGRNDLCPCGSGNKYKKCHGK